MTRKIEFDKVINRLGTYSTQWDYVEDRFGEKDLLPFTISDTDFAAPDFIVNSVKNRIDHPVFGYTRWNHDDYKNPIIAWYKDRFDTEVAAHSIVYSPSVIYSIAKLIELTSKEGEGVIIQTPAYDAFFKTIQASNRTLVENPLIYSDGIYELDFDDLEEKLADENNKILLLCSPHNPTGRVWREEELEKMVSLCKKYDVFLLSDEIHMDVVREGLTHHPILKFYEDYNHMALASSTSKTFNVPGLGGSYVSIPEAALNDDFQYILKNRDGVSSANILGITATMSAYNEGGEWVDALNDYLTANLQITKDYLKAHLPELKLVIPESTYLAWIDISDATYSMEQLQEALVHEGKVAIMDGKIYGGNGSQFLRLNVGCPQEKLEDGLERLKTAVRSLESETTA